MLRVRAYHPVFLGACPPWQQGQASLHSSHLHSMTFCATQDMFPSAISFVTFCAMFSLKPPCLTRPTNRTWQSSMRRVVFRTTGAWQHTWHRRILNSTVKTRSPLCSASGPPARPSFLLSPLRLPQRKQPWWGLKDSGSQRGQPDWAHRRPFLKGPPGQHPMLASTVYPFWPFYINRLHTRKQITYLRGKGKERNWNSNKHASYKQTLTTKVNKKRL